MANSIAPSSIAPLSWGGAGPSAPPAALPPGFPAPAGPADSFSSLGPGGVALLASVPPSYAGVPGPLLSPTATQDPILSAAPPGSITPIDPGAASTADAPQAQQCKDKKCPDKTLAWTQGVGRSVAEGLAHYGQFTRAAAQIAGQLDAGIQGVFPLISDYVPSLETLVVNQAKKDGGTAAGEIAQGAMDGFAQSHGSLRGLINGFNLALRKFFHGSPEAAGAAMTGDAELGPMASWFKARGYSPFGYAFNTVNALATAGSFVNTLADPNSTTFSKVTHGLHVVTSASALLGHECLPIAIVGDLAMLALNISGLNNDKPAAGTSTAPARGAAA